MHSDVSQD
jgi:hypothetical protein